MKILGFLGSPRSNGSGSKLLQQALAGAKSAGAETCLFELINLNIDHCRGCGNCFYNNPELEIGICPLKDDMNSILQRYCVADGYIFTSPSYDGNVTSVMKKFLERKIALTYRQKDDFGRIPGPRKPVDFKKKACMIVTANAADEYIEVFGEPCFEMMEGHLMLEQVETIDKLYVGGIENISKEAFAEKLQYCFQTGARLVNEIRNQGRV